MQIKNPPTKTTPMPNFSNQRRLLLKTALLASFAAPFNHAFATSLSGKKIIIIGAGISGLAAAQKLHNSGAEVLLLEANDYFGGRLHTDYGLGAPFEQGAGWVHGPNGNNPISQLAKNVNAKTQITDDDKLTIFNINGQPLSEAERQIIDHNWQKLMDLIDDELEFESRASLHQAIQQFAPEALKNAGVMWALSAYTEFSKGGAIENISASYHDEDEAFEGEDVVVTTGYDKILAPLAAGLNIKFGAPVHAVEYGNKAASVATNIGTFTADYVLCSVPLGILKAQTIKFSPPLPTPHRNAIKKIGFGSVTKIALKFEQAFWDVEQQYFGVQTQPKGKWNYWLNYRTFCDENILLGLSLGDYAFKADAMNDQEMQTDALQVLQTIWGDKVTTPIDLRTTHWSQNPYSLGAYSYIAAGSSPHDYEILAKPIAKRLFLAGEHTIFKYAATTHGAYLSGIRAADQILAL